MSKYLFIVVFSSLNKTKENKISVEINSEIVEIVSLPGNKFKAVLPNGEMKEMWGRKWYELIKQIGRKLDETKRSTTNT